MSEAVKHRKLVRDLIPSIIAANGGTAVTRPMEPKEYRAALHAKLAEESEELRAAAEPADKLNELADLLEVVMALARRHRIYLAGCHRCGGQKVGEARGLLALRLAGRDPGLNLVVQLSRALLLRAV